MIREISEKGYAKVSERGTDEKNVMDVVNGFIMMKNAKG